MNNSSDLFNQTNNFSNITNSNNIMHDINEYGAVVFLMIWLIIYLLGFFQNKKSIWNIKSQLRIFEQPIQNFNELIKWYVTSDNIIKKKNEIKRRRSSSDAIINNNYINNRERGGAVESVRVPIKEEINYDEVWEIQLDGVANGNGVAVNK